MRNFNRKYTSHRHGLSAQAILKAVLFVLLFSLIFSSAVIALNNTGISNALDQTGKPLSVSSTASTNLLSTYNTYSASYLKDFYIDGDEAGGASAFQWNTSGRGYGWTNYDPGSDKAYVYWLQVNFTGDLLTAAQEGRVSYYASAKATFDGDLIESADENAMAVSYVGTNTAPTASCVGTSRGGNNASWNSSYTSRFNSYSEWTNGSTTYTLGRSGTYDNKFASTSTTTGIRLIFAVISDSKLHGGFKDFNLTLYVKPKDEILSSNTNFNVTSGLYGEEYKIQATSTSNWNSISKVASQSSESDLENPQKVAFAKGADIKYTGSGNDIISMGVATTSYDLAGIFVNLRDGNGGSRTGKTVPFDDEQFKTSALGPFINCYTDFTITLPPGVTAIDFSGYLYAGSSHDASTEVDRAQATVELITSSTVRGSAYKDTTAQAGKTAHVAKGNVSINNCVVNTTASTSSTTLTIRLRLKAAHENYDSWGGIGDNGTAYALLGNIKIKMYGAYYASFNGNGASGSMTTQMLRFGINDSTETLKANAFVYPDHTFVGWSTSEGGSVVYPNLWDTSDGATGTEGSLYSTWDNELTNVPGSTINLYAVWRDSDFGKLPSGTSGKWGSATNPYVISTREHWVSLVDIVNGNRDPVDSVSGTFYGNAISSNDVQASATSYYSSYFVILNDIEIGSVDPVGIDTGTTNSTAKNFRGTIYGGVGKNTDEKVNRKLTVDISTSYASSDAVGTGLFGCFTYGTIEYITVAGSIASTNGRVGGIVGQVSSIGNKYIRHCISEANIQGVAYNTQNEISSFQQGVGGILGYVVAGAQNVRITDCSYVGDSDNIATYKVANNGGTINANLVGGNGVGGIVGYLPTSGSNKVLISGCSSDGTIVGQMNVGGIAGRVETNNTAANAISISNVYNTASVEARVSSYTVGGIVGYFYYNGTATSNAVLHIQYAYNKGSVKSGGQSAGGIVGNATVGTNGVAENVVLSYCYNDTTAITGGASNTDTTNAIVGTGTNTVENSWTFSRQSSTTTSTASFTGTNFIGINNTNAKGNFFAVAYTGANILPSDGNADSADANYDDWANITNTNLTFNSFRATGNISNGYYLRIYNAGASNTPLVSPTASTVVPWKYTVVFSADTAINKLAVARASVSLEKTSDSKVYDGANAPMTSNWIVRTLTGSTLKNQYTTSVAVQYSADGGNTWVAYTQAKNVLYNGSSVKAYSVKITLYNGSGKVVGIRILDSAFTINPRPVNLVANWQNGVDNTDAYIYNASAQGLISVTVTAVDGNTNSGKISSHKFEDLFSVAPNTNVAYQFNTDNIAVDEETVVIGEYTLALTLINKNYEYNGNSSWTWTIEKKSIANPTTANFNADKYDIYFGYGSEGVASGVYGFENNGSQLFALDMREFGVFFVNSDVPYGLLFKDNNSIYSNISKYNLLIKVGDNLQSLVRDTDYTLVVTEGGSVSGEQLVFDSGNEVQVTLTLTGIGNYGGERIVRFTLMESDFGGNFNDADWGSESNPYLIETSAHLNRLSQIVGGAKAWNSINSAQDAFVANANAKATNRTYAGTYFFLTANVTASTAGGFAPIGKNAQYPFSGNFSAVYGGGNFVVTLSVTTDSDYAGLFGYITNSTLTGISVNGSVSGHDYVGGIVGYADANCTFMGSQTGGASVTGRNFVGGIGGRIDASMDGATVARTVSITGVRAVGGIVGYFAGGTLSNASNASTISHNRYGNGGFSVSNTVFDVLDETNGINAIGGIVGLVNTAVTIADCRNTGRINAVYAVAVGGIVGYASVENFQINIEGQPSGSGSATSTTASSGNVLGGSYVGGIVGYANNVYIDEDCLVNANVTGGFNYTGDAVTASNFITTSSYTLGKYVGGVAGKWVVHDTAQMPEKRRLENEITIGGGMYVGGLLGWLDARDCVELTLAPYISNGTVNAINVIGKSYVGALYGGFEGYGYKRTSQSESTDDTTVYINPENVPGTSNPQIYVKITLLSGGNVAGGLIGYASGVGIFFLGNWTGINHTPFTFNGNPNTSFFGGIVGILGENATIGSAEQLSANGEYSIMTDAHRVQYRSTSSSAIVNIGGDFVGSIAGYIASTAGTYLTSDTTFMGNTVQLFNRGSIQGRSFVGGLFGATGRVSGEHYQINGDERLSNLLQYGKYDLDVTRVVNNTLRYAPSDSYGTVSSGLGKLFNYQAIEGTGNFVGGIVGYAGEGSLLAFINEAVDGTEDNFDISNARTYLSVYNGSRENPAGGTGSVLNIRGANYVGGIAGWLSSSAHEFKHLVSLMRIIGTGSSSTTGNTGENVGGIAGYMAGGTLNGCIATSGFTTTSDGENSFQGGANVGGLVGMLAGGSILNSISRGFNYANVDATRGGVAGRVGSGTTISASWTVYLVTGSGSAKNMISPNYSTVSKNTNGKYVIIDSRLLGANMVPTFSEYARMVGLFIGNGVTITQQATANGMNDAQEGYLSLKTSIPGANLSTALKNMQLVFYNVSGEDKNTENEFDAMSRGTVTFKDLIAQNGQMYYRFSMTDSDSFLICVVPIEFKSIPTCASTDEAVKKQNAQDKYQKPASQDDRYIAEVVYAEYDSITHNLSSLGANIKYRNGNGEPQIIGSYINDNIEFGSSTTPYIISNQTDWNTLAKHVNGTERIKRNGVDIGDIKFIKLATDDVIVTGGAGNPFMGASESRYFNGTFDGDGHTITINVSGSSSAGVSVFPYAGGAVFRNLNVKGTISTTAENAAGFVAKPSGDLEFYNCTNLTRINAKRTAGGIVGFTNGKTVKLVTCVNRGRIETDDPVEVSADYEGNNKLKDDKSLPDFANYTYGTGGIIGYATNTITIESCKNEGYIRAGYNVGGIIGQNDAETHIYNCANTGEILGDAYWASESAYAAVKGDGTYRMVYAGGIIGKVGQHGWLEMLACYNSGTITGWGPIVGGLAGSVGYLLMDGEDTGIAGGESLIAYCYNTGAVNSAGTTATYNHKSVSWGLGREELNGSIVGGIVGFIANGVVNYCYNIGKISTFRIIGYAASWQARIGGIAGQVQPSESNYKAYFDSCYNLGELYVAVNTDFAGGASTDGFAKVNWGAGICGYLDKSDSNLISRLQATNCYSLENCLHTDITYKDDQRWSNGIMTGSDTSRYATGTPVSGVDELTAYMSSSGSISVGNYIGTASDANYQAASLINRNGNYHAQFNESTQSVDYSSAFRAGTAYGYLYIYGCLPQLAVFALETKEALSMLSVSYGRNDYDEFVGSIAGSKESPYVIKDGVGLLAMSALTGAKSNAGTGSGTGYFTFKDKYIEFADGANNIEGMTAKAVNINLTTATTALKSSEVTDGEYSQSGMNYFLYSQGAVSGLTSLRYGQSPSSASTLRSNWYSNKNNYYYTDGSYDHDSSFNSFANFYPIGRNGGASSFMGSISGEQADGGNTEVRGLRIAQYGSVNSYAGLFGSVYNAKISNITVDGTIRAYSSLNANNNTFVGGIAGYAGGNSQIINCEAGRDEVALTVYAYSYRASVPTAEHTSTGKMYSGSIVGAIGPKRGLSVSGSESYADNAQKNALIANCKAVYASVYTSKNNAGGIAGFAGDPWSSANLDRNTVTFRDVFAYRTSVGVSNGMANHSETGTDIGGIVGTNDGQVIFRIEGAYLGMSDSYSVSITGENSVGGVIGSARGNTDIGNVELTERVTISRSAYGNAENVPSGEGLYFTSIGGVIGRAISGESNTLRDAITFNGNISITVPTYGESTNPDAYPMANVGGILGSMGVGTRFLGGSIVTVGGTITTDTASVNSARNIGGVVGATIDGIFDGYFDIHPTINSTNATNVGGFIGRNFGTASIVASDTSVEVNGIRYSGTIVNINGTISGKSEVGGLVGVNGHVYQDGTEAGYLNIGADSVGGTIYNGTVVIVIGGTYKGDSVAGEKIGANSFNVTLDSNGNNTTTISAMENNVGGIVGSNTVLSDEYEKRGLLIRKGAIYNFATVTGVNNVGGVVGNNEGDIEMGGSQFANADLTVVNAGNVSGENHIGGSIGYLQLGSIAGTFANIGNVAGKQYVGGSIGRVDKDAALTAGTSDTYFYNGEESTSQTAEGDGLVSDDSGLGSLLGNVSGEKYVGGSIGATFGTIAGSDTNKVVFYNVGNVTGVNGADYLGGNIGMLAGSVVNADFANSGIVSSGGSTAIGGSVGMIGKDSAVSAEHQYITVVNVHFDFTGENNIEVSGSSTTEGGGVGGAVGVIGNSANDFYNTNGEDWNSVTLYTANGVDASKACNVGGAIGIIKADNILISNMLAFYTSIKGKQNVGGIVGAVTGHGVKIYDSFNIEGEIEGTTAGGIVGASIEGDTDASTSYWVKGYTNEELMALNIYDLVGNLGKYEVAKLENTVFTEELTEDYGTVANFLGDDNDERSWAEYLRDITGHNVQLVNGVWAYDKGTKAIYTTGAEGGHAGWFYVYANNVKGLDATHTVAHDSDYPSILDAQYPEIREQELVYWKRIANAYTAQELAQKRNKALLVSGIVAKVEGTTVRGTSETPREGKDENGKYIIVSDEENTFAPKSGYIYASALASTVSGYYLYMDATGEKPSIWHGTHSDGTEKNEAPFYITADTHTANNVMVYYRAVGIGGTLTYNGYNRYVPITDEVSRFTNSDGTEETQYIEYVADFDTSAEGPVGNYVYTMDSVKKKDGTEMPSDGLYEAGTYLVEVSIYYYDAFGKPAKIGGISSNPNNTSDDDKLRINRLELGVDITKKDEKYNGKNTNAEVVLTIDGIAPLDKELNRAVMFAIGNGDGDTNIDEIYKIEGKLNISEMLNAEKTMYAYEEASASRELYPLKSTRIYVARIEQEVGKELDQKNISKNTGGDTYSDKGWKIKITFKFTDSYDGSVKAGLLSSEGESSPNYKAKDVETPITVEPQELKIVMMYDTHTFAFNGGKHSIQFNFEGWVDEDKNNNSKFVAQLMPYIVYLPASGAAVENAMYSGSENKAIVTPVSSDKYLINWVPNGSIVRAENMRDLGSYEMHFATETYFNGLPATEDRNYYLSAESVEQGSGSYSNRFIYEFCKIVPNEFSLAWDDDPNGIYNSQTHKYGVTLTAKDAFEDAKALTEEVETIFANSEFEFAFTVEEIDEQTARVIFEIGPNVKTGGYTVSVPRSETDNCAFESGTPTSGKCTILPLEVYIGLDGMTTSVYNGGFHEISGGITATTENADADPQTSFNPTSGEYTITMFDGMLASNQSATDNQVKVSLTYVSEDGTATKLAVNVGTYSAEIDTVSGSKNFELKYDKGSGSVIITPAQINLEWGVERTWTYDKQTHGISLGGKLAENIDGMSLVHAYSMADAKAMLTITNASKNSEFITITLGGTPSAINAGNYTATANMSAITLTGTNSAGSVGNAQLENYNITFVSGQSAESGTYKINQRPVSVTGMNGNIKEKVYDATPNVASSGVGYPSFNDTLAPTSYTVTAVYNNAQVGTGKTITYTVTITGADANNFDFASTGNDKMTYSITNGVINARQLVVRLDRLRNGSATRVYDGLKWYGGADGALSVAGSGSAVSEISRSGEGFSVSNIATADVNGAVKITAVYAESSVGRTAFDAYVNNVVGSGAEIALGSAPYGDSEYKYKKLVFTLGGASASNYTFSVMVGNSTEVGDKLGNSSANGAVTVNDTKNGGAGGIKIEITAYTLKVSYQNTAQSYANADNTYNTDWKDVTGEANGVNDSDKLTVSVVNNWKYENNNANGNEIPAVYKSYTVIRGSNGSNILSAKLSSSSGAHINYQLSNQPTLTIGYFIDKEEFEIGSIASLMIATYYYSVGNGVSDEFGTIISQAHWQLVASAEAYASGAGYPTANPDGTPFTDADGNEVSVLSWDDYFAYLESEAGGNRYVFLNSSEGENSGWGYYYVDENSMPTSYDKFKQIANVSGVLTSQDIAILNGMFQKTTYDGDGNVVEEKSYDWGVGGQYLTNFLKAGEGNVATAIGSVFTDFSGRYNGNGYVIDGINIIGTAGSGDNYFGMFDRISSVDGAAGEVTNVHLRNLTVTVAGSGNVFVGGLAGEITQDSIGNVSVHGSINVNVNGTAYVGGLFGTSSAAVDGVITLGSMNVKATSATVGGAIGRVQNATVSNAVSMMQIWVDGSGASVNGLVGDGTVVSGTSAFVENSVWNNRVAISGGVSYTDLYLGSVSGYGSAQSAYYYTGETPNVKGEYDVLNDVRITALDGDELTRTNPHESMRLSDIIDIYVLMYAKTDAVTSVDGNQVAVFGRTEYSMLVGNKHGTDRENDAIVIANQQGIALMRELRFATFELTNDVYMYSTYKLATASGAFYGKINSNGYNIYIRTWDGVKTMFEIEVAMDGYAKPTELLKAE